MPVGVTEAVRVVAAWNCGAITLLAVLWTIILRSSVTETRRRAESNDPGRTSVWVLVVAANAFSLFAATAILRQARQMPTDQSGVLIALCLCTVVTAWALTHTVFTMRYAHLYYRAGRDQGSGLIFPGNAPPDDFDFAYFAFTVGMCFQVSDVVVTGRSLRRAVLVHSLLSFGYNTIILALSLNLFFGLFN